MSTDPAISYDGRFVAYTSLANNLVENDKNGYRDIFIHDRYTKQTTLISVSSTGQQGNAASTEPSISADGRYVAFDSYASNLVPGDTNGYGDIFVHDRYTGETTRVSVSTEGTQGNYSSESASLSGDGRFVAFESSASNLVANDLNNTLDIFVHDRFTGNTKLVSISSEGEQGKDWSYTASINWDGRYVAFASKANNLVFNDTNNKDDVFVHDLLIGETTRVSISSEGVQGNGQSYSPSMSADGRYVVFESSSSNLVQDDTNKKLDVFLHDRLLLKTIRISKSHTGEQGNGDSMRPCISPDGRYVVFDSTSTNLIEGGTDGKRHIFVHDRLTGLNKVASLNNSGQLGNAGSSYPVVSAYGYFVAFQSTATNFFAGDNNYAFDVFLRTPGHYMFNPFYR